ncbi:MAG TPA: hypothetical protein VNA30_06450 [Mycobacteriales bacterium]|nr:hypothetical protein [Mycobacteriales bacterium]
MARGRPRRGLDAYELAVLRGSETASEQPDEDAPPPISRFTAGPFRVGPLGLLMGVLLILAVGSGVRYGGASREPQLERSCTTPALALSVDSARPGAAIRWTAVGPADTRVVLGVDVAELRPDLSPVAVPGRTPQVVGEPRLLTGCRISGVFGVQVPVGKHEVVLLRVTEAGGEPVARRPLELTERWPWWGAGGRSPGRDR